MNPSTTSPAAGALYGAVAYQYLYGRHHQYGRTPSLPRYGVRPYWRARSAPSTPKPLAEIDDGPQTVEDLVRDGFFAVPDHEPETAVLYDRRHTSWMALDDVLTQIKNREEIYKKNMNEIAWSQCYAFNELARNAHPANEEAYAVYERRMQDLRAEQRAERTMFWRDVSRIRERLPESAQQYLSAFRKLQILDDDTGDQS
jgi:hypothetical protein